MMSILRLSVFVLTAFVVSCGSDQKKYEQPRHHRQTGTPSATERDPDLPKSDFSPDYQRQLQDADKAAEEKKVEDRRRNKRVDEMIRREDRRDGAN